MLIYPEKYDFVEIVFPFMDDLSKPFASITPEEHEPPSYWFAVPLLDEIKLSPFGRFG